MKYNLNHLEKHRVHSGVLASDTSFGNNGAFEIKTIKHQFFIIVSDGHGWEHVSVSLLNAHRTPTWSEMCEIKALFWDAEEVVVQYHPAESEYVNCQPFTLHLWKPVNQEIPTPPSWMVGPKKSGTLTKGE